MSIEKEAFRFALWFSFVVVIVLFVVGLGALVFQELTAKRQEALRRGVYEESASYRQGTVREIRRLQAEIAREKDPAFKRALRSMAIDHADAYRGDMPTDLAAWIADQRALAADGK